MEAFVSEWFEDGTWASSFRHTESIRDIVQAIGMDEFPTLLRLAASSLSSMKKEATNAQYKESLDREVEEQTKRIQKKAEEQLARVLEEKQEEVKSLVKSPKRIISNVKMPSLSLVLTYKVVWTLF